MMIVCYYRYVVHSRHTVGYFECGNCTKYWEHKRAEIQKIFLLFFTLFLYIALNASKQQVWLTAQKHILLFLLQDISEFSKSFGRFWFKISPMCIDVRWKTRELGLNFLFTYYNKTRRCDDRCTNMSRSLIRWIKWAQYGKMYCSKKK